MGLKLFRDKSVVTVYYPSEDAPENVDFQLRTISSADLRELQDRAYRTAIGGEADLLLRGTFQWLYLKGCVGGWNEKKMGRPFSVEALNELEPAVQNFLVDQITKRNLTGMTPQADAGPNSTGGA